MSLLHVTTWSGRKRHLADPSARVEREWGGWQPTLCDAEATLPGGRWVRHHSAGSMTQKRIDALEPCKKCEKRRASMAKDGAQ